VILQTKGPGFLDIIQNKSRNYNCLIILAHLKDH